MATIKYFEDLDIWQLARKLNGEVFTIICNTELSKDYKLKEQINGSTGSIMDNIAEGFDREGNREFINFLSYAKGSCGECRSQLYRVYDRNYINNDQFQDLKEKTLVLSKKIAAFMIYLNKSDFKGNKFRSK